MAYAGLRCCEVAVHRSANFWQDGQGSWWLGVPHSKGGHDQQIPVPTWLGQKGSRFPDWRPLSAQSVQKRCGRILKDVSSGSTPHALRHFYATSILAATQNLPLTQVLMRHADPSTTARYAAVADRDAVAAVQGLRRSMTVSPPWGEDVEVESSSSTGKAVKADADVPRCRDRYRGGVGADGTRGRPQLRDGVTDVGVGRRPAAVVVARTSSPRPTGCSRSRPRPGTSRCPCRAPAR